MRKQWQNVWRLVLVCVFMLCGRAVARADEAAVAPMRLLIETRELARDLVEAELAIPVEPRDASYTLPLWYPKWVPGSHGPGGPVANLAGLIIRDASGDVLRWKRAAGEVYRIEVEVPAGVGEIAVSIRYVANQPTSNSMGHDCFGGRQLGVVSPGCVLLYPEGIDVDQQQIELTLQLPSEWQAATALPRREVASGGDGKGEKDESGKPGQVMYQPVTLRTLVDSPLMFGRYYRAYELVEDETLSPPHTLHIFADDAETSALNPAVVDKYREMVRQTSLLIGSHPFDRFDILLAVTDSLPKNGLEHSRSTFNVLPPASLRSPGALKGWDRLLVPHEYLHAWCGKYRRPAGMLKSDFHSPKDTELLWVYEGLTQYLGEVIEARSGLMTEEEFRHRLLVELRAATHQQGRQWRPLVDTAMASHTLRSGSPNWGRLRRSQDYYMEGMLFWLEADARIRRLSDGEKTLDDFCQRFFKVSRKNRLPKPYTRKQVVRDLRAVVKFDWDGLIARRVESAQQAFDPAVAGLLGYRYELLPESPNIPGATFRQSGGVDLLDSLGVTFRNDGVVSAVLLGSAADRARLATGMKVIAVGDQQWSRDRILEAVRRASDRRRIDLLVQDGETISRVQLQDYDGLQYWNLTRDESEPDLLREILQSPE